jgi:hypothetical protein
VCRKKENKKLKESKHGNTPEIPLTYHSNPTTNVSLLSFLSRLSLSLSLLVETAQRKPTQRPPPRRGGPSLLNPQAVDRGAGWFLVSLVSE